jgi:hypothetical protein
MATPSELEKWMLAKSKICPLAAKWAPIKSKHKALMNRSIFKGDIEPSLKALDDAVASFADALADKKKLVEVLNGMFAACTKITADQEKLKSDRDKSEEDIENNKNMAQAEAYQKQPDADPADVLKNLNDLAISIEKDFNLRKRFMDQIIAAGSGMIGVIKKGRDDYKAGADKVLAAMDKAGKAAEKAEKDAINMLGDYLDTAAEIENTDLEKQLQGFLKIV